MGGGDFSRSGPEEGGFPKKAKLQVGGQLSKTLLPITYPPLQYTQALRNKSTLSGRAKDSSADLKVLYLHFRLSLSKWSNILQHHIRGIQQAEIMKKSSRH